MKRLLFFIGFFAGAALGPQAAAQTVTLYTAGPAGLANGIAKSFSAKAGVKVELYQATSGYVLARLEAEKAHPRADVVVLASWGEGLTMRRRGFVEAYSSPEARKLRPQWTDGGLAAQGGAALALIVNSSEMTKQQEPKSWFDLTNPFWKDALTMPDPTLSGSAAEFLAVFTQVHGDKSWKLFEELARNGLTVPGPNNAALNPVLTGAKKGTIAGVDYITFGQIAKGEKLAIHYPQEGTVVALRPVFIQQGAPNREGARRLVDYILSAEGQNLVARTFMIPALADMKAQRPVPGDFKSFTPDWDFVEKNQTQIIARFRKEIVEQIIHRR